MATKPKRLVKLMLDSGIFSAWQRGEELPISEYIAYIKELEPYLDCYVGMDSIPGKLGVKRTIEQVAASAALSYKNQQIMKDAGLSPIPVFHQGESFDWLAKYLADGEKHIGISSAKDLSAKENMTWLDVCFTMLTDKAGRPLVKTHGFGITKPAFLVRYPWATVDSTTWSVNSGYGFGIIPTMGHDGKPNYFKAMGIHLSGVAQQGMNRNKTFEAMGPMMQDWVRACLDRAGVTMTEARNFSDARRRITLYYYLQLSAALKDVRFLHRGSGVTSKAKPITIDQMRVFFSTLISNTQFSTVLSQSGANDRLLSYYEMKRRPREQLIEYVTTGTTKPKGVRAPSGHDWNSEAYLNRRRIALLSRAARPITAGE